MDDGEPWDAREALRSADLKTILPTLVAYGRWRYVSATRRAPTAAMVEELIQESILRVLDGRRQWHRADPPDLVAFLCGVMRSVAGELLEMKQREAQERVASDPDKRGARAPHDPVVPESDDQSDPRLRWIEEAIGGDADLEDLYLAILDGDEKRDDIAKYLGWDPRKVSVLKKKLKRRLEQLAAKAGTNSKEGP